MVLVPAFSKINGHVYYILQKTTSTRVNSLLVFVANCRLCYAVSLHSITPQRAYASSLSYKPIAPLYSTRNLRVSTNNHSVLAPLNRVEVDTLLYQLPQRAEFSEECDTLLHSL